ncbi:MAG: tetratricopeptide repeat protein [Victivallaceae bacterium]
MKRLRSFGKFTVALLLFSGIAGYSSDICFDFEPDYAVSGNGALNAAEKRKADALTSFAVALASNDPEKSASLLIETLKNDPNAELPMRLLLNQISDTADAEKITRALAEIADANPQALKVNLVTILMLKDQDRKRGISIAENCLKERSDWKKLDPLDLKIFCSILGSLGTMYGSDSVDFSKGDSLFEDYLDSDAIGYNYAALEAAVLFYRAVEEKSDDKPFFWFFESDREKYLHKKQQYLAKIKELFQKTEDKIILAAMASLYESLGMEKEAEEALLRRILLAPDDFSAKLKLAGLFFKQRQFNKSVAVWRTLADDSTFSTELYTGYGDAAFYSRYYVESAGAYDKYLKSNPDGSISKFMRAMVYFEQGNFKKTLVELQAMPDNFMTLKVRAMAEDRLGNDREALSLLQQAENAALQNNPDFLDSIFYLFMIVLAEKNNKPDLVVKYAATIEKKFTLQDPMLANAVGFTYADMNIKLDDAEKLIRYALEKESDKAEYYDSLAWVLFRKGRLKEALNNIIISISKQKEIINGVIAGHAGDINFALGNTDDAVKYWKTALQIYSRETSIPEIEEKLKKAAAIMNSVTKK